MGMRGDAAKDKLGTKHPHRCGNEFHTRFLTDWDAMLCALFVQ